MSIIFIIFSLVISRCARNYWFDPAKTSDIAWVTTELHDNIFVCQKCLVLKYA